MDAGFRRSVAPADAGADRTPGPAARLAELLIVGLFLLVAAVGVLAHEAWFDEAQAWLLARDASPAELLSTYLRYEGHPPLWYFVLMPAAKLGAPYRTLNVISALIAAAGVVLLVRDRRIPLAIRALLPFAYFVAYQYTIVARSYVLILPLLLAILAIYAHRTERLGTFTLLLVLLSNVSLHGLSMAGAFVLLYAIDMVRDRTKPTRAHFAALAALLANVAFLVLVLRPPADLAIAAKLDLGFAARKMSALAWHALSSSLFGPNAISAIALLLLVVCFARFRTLHVFVILVASLLPIASIYFNIWHEGLFFLALVFTILLTLATRPEDRRWRAALTAIACAILLQHVWWTAQSLRYDVLQPYSGSRDAAEFIREHRIDQRKLYGAGWPVLGIQPYFARNVFANYRTRGGFTFWDWSTRAPFFYRPAVRLREADARAWMEAQMAEQPDFLLVTDKLQIDVMFLRAIAGSGRYRHIATFPGALFWKDHLDSSETFHLFERTR